MGALVLHRLEAFAKITPVAELDFEEARRIARILGDDCAVAWLHTYTRRRRSGVSFTPVTYDLDAGSTSLTIPTNSGNYEIWCLGAGGGGGWAYGIPYAGGGGGGCAYKSGSILSGEWGASITRSVGAAGSNETGPSTNDAVAGGNSTCSATLGGVSVSLTGSGGARTNNFSGAFGGTATGGDTNYTGGDGDTNGGGLPPTVVTELGWAQGQGGFPESYQPWAGRIRIKFT